MQPGVEVARRLQVEQPAHVLAGLIDLPEGRRALAVSSIAETLRSLDGVEQVQILIEGEPVGPVDVAEPEPA